MNMARRFLVVLALVAVGCGPAPPASDASGSAVAQPSASAALPAAVASGVPYAPAIDPANFVEIVDNPYLPLVPGAQWTYEGSGDAEGEVDTVTVLDETRVVMGVVCVVVRDEVTLDGEPVELTDDWYAQDADGNVWYFGEETAEYKNGEVVSTEGSWEAGVDGAQPGIVMHAEPVIGVAYRQEYYAGEAEDMARAVEVGQQLEVAAGSFEDVLVTEDWTPLEPDVLERKFYAPDVGQIAERQVEGGSAGFDLVEYTAP
jgi:hypothetical protein